MSPLVTEILKAMLKVDTQLKEKDKNKREKHTHGDPTQQRRYNLVADLGNQIAARPQFFLDLFQHFNAIKNLIKYA